MKWILPFLCCLFCLTAKAQNNITYIKMQRTACFGRCPEYTAEIFKNGNIVYTGKRNVDRIGKYTGKVSANAMAKFLKQVSKYKVSTCKSVYKALASDLPRLNFTFVSNGKTKSIKNGESGPAYLNTIGKLTDSLLNTVTWKETSPNIPDPSGPVLDIDVDHSGAPEVAYEIQPQFPGGGRGLDQFIKDHVQYPDQLNEEGDVICLITITTEGKIINPQISKGMGSVFNKEALRVISLMPDWIPGQRNGKLAEMQQPIWVHFKKNN